MSAQWSLLNGTEVRPAGERDKATRLYELAKRHDDCEAALTLVDRLVTDDFLDRLIADAEPHMLRGKPIVFAAPLPSFDAPDEVRTSGKAPISLNALPHQFAIALEAAIGGVIDTEIVQAARVGRTKARDMERILWQPSFDGAVRTDAAYILVDDVLTWGGTFAALRHHIVSNGGTVCGYAALAHGSGKDHLLAISPKTWNEVVSLFGNEFRDFWKGEIGHDAESLTEAEGCFLLRWWQQQPRGSWNSPFVCLRDCLFETAGRGAC